MSHRALLAILAISVSAGLLAAPAEAHRRHYFYGGNGYQTYYPGPEYIPADPYMRYFSDQYDAEQNGDAGDQSGDAQDDGFNDNYYQPKLKSGGRKASPAQIESFTRRKTGGVEQASRSTGDTPTGSIGKPKPAAVKTITCDKASSIVQGYGFSAVKSTSCSGATYAFAATRDGKNYAIKLNAGSGELTEVRKVQ